MTVSSIDVIAFSLSAEINSTTYLPLSISFLTLGNNLDSPLTLTTSSYIKVLLSVVC